MIIKSKDIINFIYILPKSSITVTINDNIYNLEPMEYIFLVDSNVINFDYKSEYTDDKSKLIDIFRILNLDNIKYTYKVSRKYNVIYSFDKNYIIGAMTSIFSLLHNFDPLKINDLLINIMCPIQDLNRISEEILKFKIKTSFHNANFKLIGLTDVLIPDYIKLTKCYKGGNHLLAGANYYRMLIPELFNGQVIYIDSDTIINANIAKILDKLTDNPHALIATKSKNLTFNNIINDKNIRILKTILPQSFDFSQNIYYTGTYVLNLNQIKYNYKEFMKTLVCLHNDTPGGLYKLFTMSIINFCFYDSIKDASEFYSNPVDLGFNEKLQHLEFGDILDWSGIRKPWFTNGLYQQHWQKYNLFYELLPPVVIKKSTIEVF